MHKNPQRTRIVSQREIERKFNFSILWGHLFVFLYFIMKYWYWAIFFVFTLSACNNGQKMKAGYLSGLATVEEGGIVFENPANGFVFPPGFPAPTVMWDDNNGKSKKWLINISINQSENILTEIVSEKRYKPDAETWEIVKENSVEGPAIISIAGINPEKGKEVFSYGKIGIATSADPVGSPIFFRAVPLPFKYATSHLDSIKYMLGDVTSSQKPKVLLENLPVCGNCHSFSPDGKRFAMDVDAFGDKGSYLIADVGKEVEMQPESFITWSDFQEKSTMALLSQISPNGKYVVSTLDDNEIFESREELEYSQLFFPIKGILTVYDVEKEKFYALKGADDTTYVQSNSNWSPDNEHIYFARGKAVQRNQSGMTYGTGIYDENKFQAMRDSFLSAKKEFKFDVMKIPFNNGKGGDPLMVEGASQNGMSNYFPKISPDGKWMVFCRANNYMLLQPDSKLYIMPVDGSAGPRLMNCNTSNMNSWHSWSPNNRWIVFSSKKFGAYTQLFLAHVDENGNDAPPVWLEYLNVDNRAANIPEFVNTDFNGFNKITDKFSDVADYNVRGTSKAQFGDFKNAIVDFNKALQVNKNDAQAYANRGKAKDELGDLKGALADLSKAIELAPEKHGYYIHRGNTKVKMRDLDGAIEDCNKAIGLAANDAALFAHRAGIYQLAGKFDKSIADFTKAISLKPGYGLYYMHRADVYSLKKDKAKTLQDVATALKLEPNNVKYMTLKGIYAIGFGDKQLAVSSFEKAIKINPSYYEPYQKLAEIYDAEGKFELALDNFNKAISTYDADPGKKLASLYNSRGTVYGKKKAFEKAISDFDTAINYWGNFSDAYSNRAFAKYNLGLYSQADVDCNTALQIEPGMRKAQAIKAMIKKKMR